MITRRHFSKGLAGIILAGASVINLNCAPQSTDGPMSENIRQPRSIVLPHDSLPLGFPLPPGSSFEDAVQLRYGHSHKLRYIVHSDVIRPPVDLSNKDSVRGYYEYLKESARGQRHVEGGYFDGVHFDGFSYEPGAISPSEEEYLIEFGKLSKKQQQDKLSKLKEFDFAEYPSFPSIQNILLLKAIESAKN